MGPPRLGQRHRNGLPSIKCNASLPRPLSLPPPLQRIAGHPLPAPLLSSPPVSAFIKRDSPAVPASFLQERRTMKPFRPAPARVPFLSRARTLHRDRLSCAPGTASVPKIQMASAPPRLPLPRPGAPFRVGCAPTPPPSTAAPFRAFPPNRAVIPSYRLLQIFFAWLGNRLP